VSFKVGFPAAFMDKLALLTALGLADTSPVELPSGTVVPRELLVHSITTTATTPGPEAAPDDAEALWVRVRGRRAGHSGDPALAPRVEVLAECVVRPHQEWRAGAGQLDTGVPPSIVAQLLGHEVIDRPGVFAPEDAVPPEPFLAELARRHMEVVLVTREPAATGATFIVERSGAA
jgi:saccharopine dehydrogenase-like NADP-dependent oxidoreductase